MALYLLAAARALPASEPPFLVQMFSEPPVPRPDSVLADTLVTVAGDSAALLEMPIPAQPKRWDSSLVLRLAGRDVGDTLLTRETLFKSSAMLLSDALLRDTALGMHIAGSHGAWDIPFVIGPGAERLSLWFESQPATSDAIPEALAHTMSPLLMGSFLRIAPDPFLDPLADSRDGMLWGTLQPVREGELASAIRLAEGAGDSKTQDVFLGRTAGAWHVLGAYGHSSSEGRPAYIQPRYSGTAEQNLLASLERTTRRGPVRFSAAQNSGRWDMPTGRKLIWQSQRLALGWQFGGAGRVQGQCDLALRYGELRAWRLAMRDRRQASTATFITRAAYDLPGMRLLASVGAERADVDFSSGGEQLVDRVRGGVGSSLGAALERPRWSLYGAGGWSWPWWGHAHPRGHVVAAYRPGGSLSAMLEGWLAEDVPFVPRMEGDTQALTEEWLLLPGQHEAWEGPRRKLRHAQARVMASIPGLRATGGVFARRIENGIGLDGDLADLLRPDVRDTVPLEDLLSNRTLSGASLALHVALPLGCAIAGDGLAVLDPPSSDLPVLVPPYRARAVFSASRTIFKGDITLEGRLIMNARGEWTTPWGKEKAFALFDAEIHGTINATHLYLALRNLENLDHPSATYIDGVAMPLVFRSYQAGVEWHFAN